MMALVTWDKSMRVGNARIDNQHKRLFEIANRFHETSEAGGEREELLRIMDELVEHTRVHFTDEEEHMFRHGFAGVEQHKDQHEKLLKLLRNYRARLEVGEADAAKNALAFIKDWLNSHTSGDDRRIGEHTGVR